MGQQALWVESRPCPRDLLLPNAKDWPFVATALTAACLVITGNARHFPARLGVAAFTVRSWM